LVVVASSNPMGHLEKLAREPILVAVFFKLTEQDKTNLQQIYSL